MKLESTILYEAVAIDVGRSFSYRPNRSRLTRVNAEGLLVLATYTQAIKTVGVSECHRKSSCERGV
ncbi:hypothetical protein NQ318_006071 [Aromia moschata]|uniref:Uncharacterized protein n=1 Tax=Aromia moschata TaxID=1265417 RepID=A0AAV8Z443_9CUCU|nr:hypothetical protein NQ318_006071 [Aromia moschata]